MRILLVQTAFFGDLMLSTPVIKALHEIFPNAEISLMTTKAGAPLVARDPLLKRVIPFDKRGAHAGWRGFLAMADELRSFGFDRVYSLHRSYRTALLLRAAGIPLRIGFENARFRFCYHQLKPRPREKHDVLRNLSILEGEGAYDRNDTGLRLFAPQAADVRPEILELTAGQSRKLVVFPGSEWQTKMWHWGEYRRLVQHYASLGVRVLLMGGPKERAVATRIADGIPGISNLAGQTSLDEALYIVKHASLVVCNDSMALHMAGGFKVPVVSVFCATSPSFGFGPWQTLSQVIEREDLPCKPCRRHGSRQCPLGTEECMRGVPAARVIRAVDELLTAKSKSTGSQDAR